MAGRRPQRIPASPQPVTADVQDPATSRALRSLGASVGAMRSRGVADPVTVDLAVGSNFVRHSLGREPRYVQITPTVADASFAWAWIKPSPHSDRQVRIDVVGVDQPGAVVIVS